MPLAKDVAAELRQLADSLDQAPNKEVIKPTIYFSHWGQKEMFMGVAPLLPRPIEKEYGTGTLPDLILKHNGDALNIRASIQRSVMCVLVEPAKPAVYDCLPILEQHELDAISA